jgi:hypothetical protein
MDGIRGPLPLSYQRSMAIEGLLAWTKGAIRQGQRLSEAHDRVKEASAEMSALARSAPQGRALSADSIREAVHVFQVERHLFCIAANKIFEYRHWIARLGRFDMVVFEEIDVFEPHVKAMRDLNEHAIEYFEERGLRRDEWIFSDGESASDPTGTINTKIGNRLDWVAFGAAARKLLSSLSN